MPFINPSELSPKELLPGWTARFFHSERMTFSYTEVAAGGQVHSHHHPEEEVWNIVDGAAEITLDDEVRLVHAGEAAVIPSDVEHSARTTDGFRAIIVDSPVREAVAGISTR